MNSLKLGYNNRICFVTPYGDDRSGISDFSYVTINELANHMRHIDIYTDCNNIEYNRQANNIHFYKIDDIVDNHDRYDMIIWVMGNSPFHEKMIHYGKRYGGAFLIHDETMFELYSHKNWIDNKELEPIHSVKLREKCNNINNLYRCFADIIAIVFQTGCNVFHETAVGNGTGKGFGGLGKEFGLVGRLFLEARSSLDCRHVQGRGTG